jgi:hypothetical protein
MGIAAGPAGQVARCIGIAEASLSLSLSLWTDSGLDAKPWTRATPRPSAAGPATSRRAVCISTPSMASGSLGAHASSVRPASGAQSGCLTLREASGVPSRPSFERVAGAALPGRVVCS